MNIIQRIWSRIFQSGTASPASWFVDWIRGDSNNDSGVPVNGKTAMQYAPLWYAVNKIAGHVAQLPCELRELQDGPSGSVSKLLTGHPAYWLMNWQPNEFMTPSVFRETMQHHALLWGNGRAAIYRNNRRDPIELIPLLPDRTSTVMVNGEKWHVVTNLETQEKTKFRDNEVVHICGMGYDGIQGYSLIEFAKNSTGAGLAGEKHINKHFKNNAVPGLVLEAPPGAFRDEQQAIDFLRRWDKFHAGSDNASRTGLLREGMKASVLGMNGRDAQWIEQRIFQRQEMALWFLLEHIVGDGQSVSYNSLEQKSQGYIINCLMRWLVKWEEELARKLLTRSQFESARYYWKFKTAALLRGTTKERFEVYEKAIQNRILNPNECREKEDLPPYEGGDVYENPNTTSSASAQDDSETPDKPPPQTSTKPSKQDVEDRRYHRLASRAMQARLNGFVKVEKQRIMEAVDSQPTRFVQWIDTFYASFETRIRDAVVSVGGVSEDSTTWVTNSKDLLLECAGRATYETLPQEIESLLSGWGERTDNLVNQIMERELCEA